MERRSDKPPLERTVLITSMTSATRCNLKCRTLLRRLVAAGKRKALTACMQKMPTPPNPPIRDKSERSFSYTRQADP